MAIEPLVARARALLDKPVASVVEEWKADHPGRKAFAWFPVYTPVELIHASGMFPVAVIGGGNQIEIAHADSRFQSFVCSVIKSTLELGLIGQLEPTDGIVFHSICDPAKNLASVFRRNFPDKAVEFIHFPQNMSSPSAADYLEFEYRRILGRLSIVTGEPVDDEALDHSVAVYNENRAKIRELYRVRRESPNQISATDAYLVVRAGTRMLPEEHTALLDDVLREIPNTEALSRDRIKVIVEGSFCEQPPLELLQAIEEAGCQIVDDDFLLGTRWFTSDVERNGNPLRGMAESYLNNSVHSAVKHDLRHSKSAPLLRKLRKSRADAVIILAAKFCEPALFDYALCRQAFEAEGVPHLFLEFEEKMWIFDRVRNEVETFVESMLFD